MSEQQTEKYKLVAFDFFDDVVHEYKDLVTADDCVPSVSTFNVLQQIFCIEQESCTRARQQLISSGYQNVLIHTFDISWIYSIELAKFDYLNKYKDTYPVQRDYFHTHDIVCAFGIDCDESNKYLVVRYTD